MNSRAVVLSLLTALGGSTLLAAPAVAVQDDHDHGGRPAFDVRSGERTPVPQATAQARELLARRLGGEGTLSGDRRSGGIRSLGRTDGFLTPPAGGDAEAVALDYLRDNATAFNLDAGDLAALRLVGRSTSGDGVTHLTWLQTSRGIAAYDSVVNANVTADGRLLNVGGAPTPDLALASTTPLLTASEALRVAQQDVHADPALPRASASPDSERVTRFANGDTARLVAFAAPGGDRLAWRLTVAGEQPFLYDVVVDARSGELLARNSLTDFASAEVYDAHPSAGVPGNTVDLARWLGDTQGGTRLFGPNAHAYADIGAPNGVNAGENVGSSGGGDWSYGLTPVAPGVGATCSAPAGGLCSWDGVDLASAATNRAQTTTQLFYFVNRFHDWLAQPPIGFDATSRNFEGADRVLAEAQDYEGFNNANMSTPPDGSSPRMQMYLWRAPFPAISSADDAAVVYHEYTHGLSNRLVAGGTGTQLRMFQPRAMGEGWSDWYALDYLVAQDFLTDTAADGEVATGTFATGNGLTGIRRQATDCPVDSPAAACAATASSHGQGGYTFADVGRVGSYNNGAVPRFQVHDDGEIWAQTLWDLRRAVGASTARALITNGMRLTAMDNPSFLDARDAILQADLAAGGGDRAAIWQVFARRGMGFGARISSPQATRGIASFTLPQLAAAATPTVDDAPPLGDGDGVAEPGEAVRLGVALTNVAGGALTNVRATLGGPAGVVVGGPRASWGTLAVGASATAAAPFAVTLPATRQCGLPVALTLNVSSDQGTATLPLSLPVGAGRTSFAASGGLPLAIPNNSALGATATLTVPSAGRVDRLRVTISLAHPFVGDLHAELTSPSGTTVALFERPGVATYGSVADGLTGVVLDDAAALSIQEIPVAEGPALSGIFRPDQPLALLAGEERAGTWRLRLTDVIDPDAGTLTGWAVETDQPACATSAPALPSAATGAVAALAHDAATLTGTVDSAGAATGYAFEHGTTSDYGSVTPVADAGSGSGAVARTAALSGLTPSTTYHYRLIALRGDTVVALGEDRSFTTTAAPVTPPPGDGGGGGGGGTPTPPGDGGGGGGGGTPTPPGDGGGGGTPTPPPTGGGTVPPATVTLGVFPARKLTLNRRNAFALAFSATPAGARGTLRFTLPKQQRRAAVSFSAPFTVDARGVVKLTVTVRSAALRRLRQLRGGARTAVTVTLGGRTFRRTLTLAPPAKRARRPR
ncbi:MAG TPA: M36 family metallopeptidase [Conexibacter sp.]|nr:M36 family metallopeptidase [Conexibacter sp.]